MLLWSVATLGLLPPRDWLEAALRAAAALALAAPPLALATTLHGAARLGALEPAAAVADQAAADAGEVQESAVAPVGDVDADAVPPAPLLAVATAGWRSRTADAGSCRSGDASDSDSAADRPRGLRPPSPPPLLSSQPSPLAFPDALSPPPARPLPPPPVRCQSLLAAFSRAYLRRCAGALGAFGPSQVVDLLQALLALSTSGHLPPPAAMPLPLPSLLDAAASRLQRCYQHGLGLRHLTAAAAALAALRHAPPAAWMDWWMDEVYDNLVRRRRLSARDLTAALRGVASLGRAPGPTWSAAALAAAGRPTLRRTSRARLTELAEALAEAGVRLDVAPQGGDAGGDGSSGGGAERLVSSEAGEARISQPTGPSEATSPAERPGPRASAPAAPVAGLAARRAWLRDFLRCWVEGRPSGRNHGDIRRPRALPTVQAGGRRRCRVRDARHFRRRRTAPVAPSPKESQRMLCALTAVAGPPPSWPATHRAALELAMTGRVLSRGLRRRLVDRAAARHGAGPGGPSAVAGGDGSVAGAPAL
ncbi:hypothetical protein GPECTOR_90g533 [Gonium pectorale]|uniref:Uncharacterized protein n=1 Tax=Gonium pectorale TaxID=33097 RepID=A0A150G0P3_GONPE|nr:hypothetical protein GPECTOR_90g533 [Gonium pectorale]|eukprot:KXZ43446.1 hypothetical protein GPECTOR_90g533 [Gonium pectorale]